MKKIFDYICSLFKKKKVESIGVIEKKHGKVEVSIPQTTKSFNVNGLEEDITKVCNTGVLTIFSKCEKLDFGCEVFLNYECTDNSNLIGKHFHDYSNDVVYQVQEDGTIINLGKCN